MKKKALFIQYPSISHLNGGNRIADILKRSGYEVYYFIDSKMAQNVISRGFTYYPAITNPIVEYYDEEALSNDNITYSFSDRFRDNLLGVFINSRKKELFEVVTNISPDIIIADTFAGSDFILIYPLIKSLGIRFFYLETMLSSIDDTNTPYLNSKLYPNQKFRIKLEFLQRKYLTKCKRFLMKLKYLGNDNISSLATEISKAGLPSVYRLNKKNYMHLTITNIPTLIMAPLELEFFNKKQNQQQFYLNSFKEAEERTSLDVDEALDKILKSNKTIIYVSFGTLFGNKMYSEILNFLTLLDQVLDHYEGFQTIFSCGKVPWSNDAFESLRNISIFNYVPQRYVLNFTKLFITHAGLNSIKESIEANVPMLAYPLFVDQIGNSKKLHYKKLGLAGSIKSVSEENIRQNLDHLLLNHSNYEKEINLFKKGLSKACSSDNYLLSVLEVEGNVSLAS
ncbi:glycosyltransferase [Sphingobacterium sp. HSC-15S19]|uniref:glycosyltransferase n=2 Tax=Bacteroidota/Chlorobiota group TaxID=68336 RepID=UPI003D24A0F8